VDVPLVVGLFDKDDKNDEEERVVRPSDVGVVEIELCDAEEETLGEDCRRVIDGEAVSLDKRCKASDEKDKLLDEEGDMVGGNEDVDRSGSEELGADDVDEDSPVIGSFFKLLETLVDILGPEVFGGDILVG
jgi:hypothetical protein